jgi:hypothetical protein
LVTGNISGNAATATTATNATTATSAGCVNSDTGNVGGSRLQYWQVAGNTTLNPDGEWYNAIRMGHGDPVTYYSNTLAIRMTGGNLGDIYTRTTTNGATGSWNRFWHNNNDGAGSGLDADLLDGNGSATANTVNTIVLRDGSGNFSAGTITAALSGNATTATTLQTARTIGGVSFNGSANIDLPGVNAAGNQNTSGNAATATNSTQLGGVVAARYVRNDTDGTAGDLFSLVTVTKSLTVTTSWLDTGISAGSDLVSGAYILTLNVDNYAVSGGHYNETYTGIMYWYAGGTNSTDYDEIPLHKSGHAPNTRYINLRTLRGVSGVLKLQIISSVTTSGASNYIFKFRRMI